MRGGYTALLLAFALAGCAGDPPKRSPAPKPATKTAPATPAKPGPATPGRTGRQATAPKTPAAKKPAPTRALTPEEQFNEAVGLIKTSPADAEPMFLALTTSSPGYSGPWTNLGILYAKSNRREQARQAFTKALNINSQNPTAHTWLGIVYRELGDLARAEAAYKRALAVKPAYAPAHLNLGILYDQHLKRPADAIAHYQRYQELAGQDDLRAAAWLAELKAGSAARAAPATEKKP